MCILQGIQVEQYNSRVDPSIDLLLTQANQCVIAQLISKICMYESCEISCIVTYLTPFNNALQTVFLFNNNLYFVLSIHT